MSHIHLTKEDLIGSYEWKGNLDLLNIIMIGLAKELPEHDETYELHRLLGALLSRELTVDEKLDIIGKEYDRNLLGGLYRENPVKLRNYEAVKSSKKWENVGNSYIIPALLLYRYSYI